jgi:hypothetical protein
MSDFISGQQPCKNYVAEQDGNEYAVWDNVHECFCGHSKGLHCPFLISFCENCNKDHHEDGYQACICEGKGWI